MTAGHKAALDRRQANNADYIRKTPARAAFLACLWAGVICWLAAWLEAERWSVVFLTDDLQSDAGALLNEFSAVGSGPKKLCRVTRTSKLWARQIEG